MLSWRQQNGKNVQFFFVCSYFRSIKQSSQQLQCDLPILVNSTRYNRGCLHTYYIQYVVHSYTYTHTSIALYSSVVCTYFSSGEQF